jgi:pimeloyl-ACP methyl ester carboxylesterase
MLNSKTIVFIHGLFQNPKSWAKWKSRFEAKRYQCYTPAYPYHDGEPSDLRSKIDPNLGLLTFQHVIDSLAGFIDTLPERPMLIGHSMGGLAVQKLVATKRGVAGVCIDTAPPSGVFTFKWSFLKANLPAINPLKGNSVFTPDVEWFHYAFCNTMTLEQTQKEYDQFVVPESRNIARSSTGKEGRIYFNQPHNPLLFIAGEKDNIIPASLNKANFDAYKDKNSRRDFREFSDRTHYICGQENWEEVADFVEHWLGGL